MSRKCLELVTILKHVTSGNTLRLYESKDIVEKKRKCLNQLFGKSILQV